ncbi:hypothetical protein SG0102_07000 [Intestinibaculum porci]|uniref:RNA polymerase sigma factor SigS n=1 Tax=Intestinibaculum porci TaxID=2487118 RepID=A0A3G9J4T6_9FIRM|nr:sigma-70 family RNA polymerase sigma factor [Intestinibaculum porci]BBH25766.1 hypothetical protein SG0102_07000 [Intestinibaculum porci]
MYIQNIREYIYLARCGDADAYDEVFHYYRILAYKVTRTYTEGNIDVYNHLLSGFEYVLSQYEGYSQSSFATYAFTCLKHRALQLYNRMHKQAEISLEQPVNDDESKRMIDIVAEEKTTYNPLAHISKIADEEAFQKFLEKYVNPDHQMVIKLHNEGFTTDEIAKRTHFSPGNIYNIIYRVEKQYREYKQRKNQKMVDFSSNKKTKDI